MLGAIIAVVDRGSFPDAVATYVTEPLGMRDNAFVAREPERLTVAYADGSPRAVRMDEPHRVEELVFSPARAFDQGSFQSGGGGMVGTAGDFMTFLETLRTGGAPILARETVEMASRNQVGRLREQADLKPGWGFGLLSGVVTHAGRAGTPARPGTLEWGGVYGHKWLHDPQAELSIVSLTNTAFEGCVGSFPDDVQAAVYGSFPVE